MADPGAELVVYDVMAGEYPADVGECDGYLVTGSKHGVYDGLPWIAPLEEFVRKLRDLRKPVIGICFGHQLVAQALGGVAGKSDRGWGLGVQDAELSRALGWTSEAEKGSTVTLSVCHQDQVSELPPGAERFLESEFCPNAGFTVGDAVLCFQGHPEFGPEYTRYLIEKRGGELGEDELRRLRASVDRETAAPLVSRWIRDFVARARKSGDGAPFADKIGGQE